MDTPTFERVTWDELEAMVKGGAVFRHRRPSVSDEWEDYLQQPIRPRPADDRSTPNTGDERMDLKAINIKDLKEGLKRVLPVLKTVAALTPNPYDNLVVAFVEQLLAASDEQVGKLLS